jgi:hypothetical protein
VLLVDESGADAPVLRIHVAVGKRVASGAVRTMPTWPPISSNATVSRRF